MGVPIGGDAMKIPDFANVITVLLVVIVVVSDFLITKSVQAKLPLLKNLLKYCVFLADIFKGYKPTVAKQ